MNPTADAIRRFRCDLARRGIQLNPSMLRPRYPLHAAFSVEATGTPPDNWSAHVQFAAAEAASASYWASGRKIITNDGTSQHAFMWDPLSPAQKLAVEYLLRQVREDRREA